MGGVRVGIITLVPGRGHTSTGDGMFDDMKAGKRPDSSVPDPDVCD